MFGGNIGEGTAGVRLVYGQASYGGRDHNLSWGIGFIFVYFAIKRLNNVGNGFHRNSIAWGYPSIQQKLTFSPKTNLLLE